jgi:2-polyprenyl-6-methoxyphenol hydroxylase-like FAD-dependent oxidoreductase
MGGITTTLCCRRIVLDQILMEAAISAGAVIRQNSRVNGVLVEGDRVVGVRVAGRDREITERAGLVVGADGHRSAIARLVSAPVLYGHESKTFTYYSYWAGLPFSRVELFFRPGLAMAALPTNDNQHIVVVQRPISVFDAFRGDVSDSFLRCVDVVPRLGEAVRQGDRAGRFRGAPDQFGVYRGRRGCGWVLAGDAACHKDSVTARGISDAFDDAHTLAATLNSAGPGRSGLDAALSAWERTRLARVLPVYTRAASLADLAATEADEKLRLRRIAHDQDATDAFLSVDAGTGQPQASDCDNKRKDAGSDADHELSP